MLNKSIKEHIFVPMRMAKAYLNYMRNAKTRHGVHSPFVYNLIEDVFKPNIWKGKGKIKALRKSLKADNTLIEIDDLGAGSRKLKSNKRRIKDIVKISAGNIKQCGVLNRLATKLESKHILELGTNLGLATASLGIVPSAKKLISIEGDASLAEIAKRNLNDLAIEATVLHGSFETQLPLALNQMPSVDFAYIDGNHQENPTLEYFDAIAKHCTHKSVIIVGDIHWSEGMEKAWETIKTKSGIRVTIDLFDIGLVFFDPALSREDFIIKNSWTKH